MTITANLPDGRQLTFPDGTSQSVIQNVVRQQLQSTPPPLTEEEATSIVAGEGQRDMMQLLQNFQQNRIDQTGLQLQELLQRRGQGEQGLEPQIQQLQGQIGGFQSQMPEQIRQDLINQQASDARQLPQSMSLVDPARLGAGALQGGFDIASGLTQAGIGAAEALGVDTGEAAQEAQLTRDIQAERTRRQTAGGGPLGGLQAGAGEIVGGTAALPVGGLQTKAAQSLGGGLKARAATSSLVGAGAGAVSAAGVGEDPLKAALVGGGLGGTFELLSSAGQNVVRRFINANEGNYQTKEISDLIRASDEHGIEVFADDLSRNKFIRSLGQISENVPLGASSGRVRQFAQQEDAARKLLSDVRGDLIGDVADIAQRGVQRRLQAFKKVSGKKFGAVADELDRFGNVPRDNFNEMIDRQITLEAAKVNPDQELIDLMGKFKGFREADFTGIRQIRSELGGEISKRFKNPAIGGAGTPELQAIKNALEQDIESFAKVSPKGLKAFRDANKFYKDKVVPFQKRELSNLLEEGKASKVVNFLRTTSGVAKDQTERARKLFKNMDVKGRKAIRASLIEDAMTRAMKTDEFSSRQFSQFLKNNRSNTGVFFDKADKTRIEGLIQLLDATEGAVRATRPGLAGAAVVGGGGAAAVQSPIKTALTAGTLGPGLKRLLQTDKGKKLLLGLGQSSPGTAFFDKRAREATNLLIRAAAIEGGQ